MARRAIHLIKKSTSCPLQDNVPTGCVRIKKFSTTVTDTRGCILYAYYAENTSYRQSIVNIFRISFRKCAQGTVASCRDDTSRDKREAGVGRSKKSIGGKTAETKDGAASAACPCADNFPEGGGISRKKECRRPVFFKEGVDVEDLSFGQKENTYNITSCKSLSFKIVFKKRSRIIVVLAENREEDFFEKDREIRKEKNREKTARMETRIKRRTFFVKTS
jgi:hypothetical protein